MKKTKKNEESMLFGGNSLSSCCLNAHIEVEEKLIEECRKEERFSALDKHDYCLSVLRVLHKMMFGF